MSDTFIGYVPKDKKKKASSKKCKGSTESLQTEAEVEEVEETE